MADHKNISIPLQIQNLIEDLLRKPNPLLVILGPTASGKTKLSLEIAKKYNGEIISADSRQIYKYLDISTEKILPNERENIPHYMIDIVEPDEIYTVGEYKRDALVLIKKIHERGHLPMIVGGTGLYISSIIHNYEIPKVPPQPAFRTELEKETTETLYEKLKIVDPKAAEKIHHNNRRYIIRALEINKVTQKNKTDKREESPFSTLAIGIEWPREELYDRINKRVDSQIQRGLLEEIQEVMKKGYNPDLPSMTAIGCKELLPYFEGKMTLEEAKDLIQRNTRGYARRQLTWFRREKDTIWISPEGTPAVI